MMDMHKVQQSFYGKMMILALNILAWNVVAHAEKNVLLDKIVARVNGVNILYSDLEMPRIAKEGEVYSLDECILEEVLVQKAIAGHMVPSTVDIERQIVAFKIQNGMSDLSDAEFENQLKKGGFTLKMYREQIGRLMAVDGVRRAETSEKLVVTSQEVEDYHKKHPAYVKEGYLLHVAQLKTKDAPESEYRWQDLGWIDKVDLDQRFSFVTTMLVGQASSPMEGPQGYQVVKLIDKREPRQKTLDERYGKIERLLHQEKREKYLSEFEKEELQKASIMRF